MASNKRPRKKYTPKPKFADPVSLAIRGCSPLGAMDIGQFMSPLRGAVSAILTSSAVREDWVCVFDPDEATSPGVQPGVEPVEI